MLRVLLLNIIAGFLTFSLASADYLSGKKTYDQKNYLKAMKELSTEANNGNPKAQFLVAKMYDHGQGVNEDIGQAVMWHLKAARQGYAPAMYRIGRSEVWYLLMDADQIETSVVDTLLKNSKFSHSKSITIKQDVRRYISSHKVLVASALIVAAEQGDESALMDKNDVLSNLTKMELNAAIVQARNLNDGEAWLRAILN